MPQQKTSSWILFIILAFTWGSSFILMKIGAGQLTGWQIGAIRIAAASLVFLPIGILHLRQLPKNKIPLVFLTGVIGNLIPAFLFGIAIQQEIESSLAGVLNSLTPLFVIVIGVLFFKAKVQSKKMAGVLIGFTGLFLLSITKGPVTMSNVGFTLLILSATVLYGLNVNIISTYLKNIDPLKIASVSIGFLLVPSSLVLWFNPVSFHTVAMRNSILACVTLGIVGSAIATAIYYMLIKKAGGLFASLVTYAIPIVAIFWGVLSGEQVRPMQIGCLAIILAGVYLTNK